MNLETIELFAGEKNEYPFLHNPIGRENFEDQSEVFRVGLTSAWLRAFSHLSPL